MPYLPQFGADQTAFPLAQGKDLAMAIRLAEERYDRHYPLLPYYSLKKSPTSVDSLSTPSGAPGTTKFDRLRGEAVDPNMATWTQPHLSDPPLKTSGVEVYAPPVQVHFRVFREMKETDLKKYGFDKFYGLLLVACASQLDRHGLTLKAGDKTAWDGQEFSVLAANAVGYWKNTNVRLYVAINCQNARLGS